MSFTRLSPDSMDQAKVPRLCITPLGLPVVPEVYMMVANSSALRTGDSVMGAVLARISSHFGQPQGGASGIATQRNVVATPAFIPSQPSSLPMNNSLASLCSRIWRTVSAAKVGYSGTETPPAIQMAQSAIIHQAVFLEIIATRSPGWMPRLFRWAAMRRVWSST